MSARLQRSTPRGTKHRRGMAEAVVDASALVDLLLDNELGRAVRRRIAGHALHAPAHVDAEVLSALGRLHRADSLDAGTVEVKLRELAAAPIERHPVHDLLLGTWARRQELRLVDAIYIELAVSRGVPLVTTDRRLRGAPSVEVVAT
ncbi:PilT protein domain protein [Acidimicrobium ferrooxidans DSM 10331]|uniref:Ribonuclease VapC n=2 Tax=Acidimicrobium ferrooxidans TaxID=53635 RepID=C7LY21_ACIFD|nr:PilT protein domain protein [Acidimicrobium ferrooxidans DSM 10331]